MKKQIFLFFAALLPLVCMSCSDEDDLADAITPSAGSEAYFDEGMEFSAGADVKSITFTATRSWQVVKSGTQPAGWCIVTPASGNAGTVNVSIAVSPNYESAQRSTELTIRAGSASSTIVVNQAPQPISIPEGLSFSPETPDADQPLTVYYKAASSSPFYNYNGELYAHTGIVNDGTWECVQAEWNENTDKCKLSKMDNNVWTLTLSPSVRQWYGSGETPVKQLGFVLRSEDGSLQTGDLSIGVTDQLHEGFVPAAIRQASLPAGVKEGINVIDNSTVTLVLYDLDTEGRHKDYAHVVGDFNNWQLSNEADCQMLRDDAAGCWWITLNGLDASREYAFQYYVGTQEGGSIRLGDAYCEKILDPDNDTAIPASTYTGNKTYPEGGKGIVSVFRIEPDNYNWQVTDFKIENPDKLVIYELLLRDFSSTSDLTGALQRLDYLKEMGINAIELMPVQEFDGNDSWGYNPCYYFALDKAYGDKQTYKLFIDACHEKGIAVLFDVVYNQATGSMPFAKLYWDTENNCTAANNPYFNVEAPHPYNVFHDFNHESALVRQFVKRNLQFLLEEYHIDGFRFDLTKGFTQNSSTESTASNYDASRIAILKDYYAAIKEVKPDAFVVLEHFCDTKEETELATEGIRLWRNLNNAYCQTAMGYSSESAFTSLYESMPQWVGFMESHDEERAAYKQTQWGDGILKTNLEARMKQLEANASFFFTVPGPKMVWQFGEMGYDVSIDENGRTGKKPLHWEYLDNAYRKSLQETYARLMELRNENPELFEGNTVFSWQAGITDWQQGRFITSSSATKHLVVAGNFTENDAQYTLNLPVAGTWYNYLNGEQIEAESRQYTLNVPAHTAIVLTTFP